MATKKLEVLITGNAKAAQKAFGDLERSASTSGKKAESGLSKVQQGLVGLGVGTAVWGAFSAFDDAQKVMAQTEAVIKSTGGAANVTAREVESLAGALSKKTGIDDEAIQSGENLLLTFTGIRNEVGAGNDIFNQATAAALDMSVALGQDMSSASQTLGKALNDPMAGLSKLTKIGVVFDDQQKAQIRTLSESGDKLGAQKVILAELNREFGGSAEAQKTALGSAKVAVDNMAESVGGALAPALETGARGLTLLADGFSALPSGAQTATVAVVGVGVAALTVGPRVLEMAGTLRDGAKAAVGFGKSMSEAIGQVAATQGVSKGRASIEMLKSSISGVGLAAPAAAVGVGLLAAVYVDLTDSSRKAAKASAELNDIMQSTGASLEDAFNEKLANTIAKVTGGFDLSGSGKRLSENLDAMGVSAAEFSAALLGTDEEYEAFKANLVATSRGSHDAAIAYTDLSRDLGTLRAAGKDAATSQDVLAATNKQLGVSALGAAGDTEALTEEEQQAADASRQARLTRDQEASSMDRLADRAAEATARITEFYDAQTEGLATKVQVEQGIDDLTAAFATNGATLDINEQKGRDNVSALIDLKDAAIESAMATRDQTGSTALASQELTNYAGRLADAMRQAGFTEDQVRVMIQQMGLTPSQIATTFNTNATQTEQRAKDVKAAFDRIPPIKGVQVNANTAQAERNLDSLQQKLDRLKGASLGVGLGAPKPRAKGGPVTGGKTYLVGEKGPELFTPPASGTIIPNHRLGGTSIAPASSSAPVYLIVQVEGSVVAERQLVQVVRDGLIEVGRRTGRDPLAVP